MAERIVRVNRNVSIRINNTKWRRIEKEIKKLDGAFTAIGLHEGDTNSEGELLAMIGAVNEFGEGIIPERSFMRSWFDKNRKAIERVTTKLYGLVLDEKINAERALKLLGEFAEAGIKQMILDVKKPPNAASTIRKKRSSNPLINHGTMRNSIKHKEYYGGKKPR